jgi:glycosyltransferase involved in cell wall biosynthesis
MKVLVAVPVFNEEAKLAESVAALSRHLESRCRLEHEIVIADNGSTDGTLAAANAAAARLRGARVVHLAHRGRGGAVKQVWSESAADILTYMDVDLSTGLEAFMPLVEALASGGYDLGAGSRLQAESVTRRSWRREVISRCYNRLIKVMFRTRFSDAQCGFKAITHEAARALLPAVEDTGWFFDTELLVLSEKCGYRIRDLPVVWAEGDDTRVRILSTAWGDIKGLIRLRRSFRRGAYDRLRKPPPAAKGA